MHVTKTKLHIHIKGTLSGNMRCNTGRSLGLEVSPVGGGTSTLALRCVDLTRQLGTRRPIPGQMPPGVVGLLLTLLLTPNLEHHRQQGTEQGAPLSY